MTYNVFGVTLNLTQPSDMVSSMHHCCMVGDVWYTECTPEELEREREETRRTLQRKASDLILNFIQIKM